jgi:hypothetical protein
MCYSGKVYFSLEYTYIPDVFVVILQASLALMFIAGAV